MNPLKKTKLDPLKVWRELVTRRQGKFFKQEHHLFDGVCFIRENDNNGGHLDIAQLVIVLRPGAEERISNEIRNIGNGIGKEAANYVEACVGRHIVDHVGLIFLSPSEKHAPSFLSGIFPESALGTRFYGMEDLKRLCESHPETWNRFFSTEAQRISTLESELDNKEMELVRLRNDLRAFEKEFSQIVDMNRRVRQAEAWRNLIRFTLHKMNSLLGAIPLKTNTLRIDHKDKWTDEILKDIDDYVSQGMERLDHLMGRDIKEPQCEFMSVDAILTNLRNLADEMGAESIIPQKMTGYISVDYTMFTDAVREILNNARYWTKDKESPEITLRIKKFTRADSKIFFDIIIADNGPGVPDDLKEAIFLPTISTRDSTGLGLAGVASDFHHMDGDVMETGGPGKGALFTLRLPLLKEKDNA